MNGAEKDVTKMEAQSAAPDSSEDQPHPDHVFTWGDEQLHFTLQPKVSNGEIIGFEALLRDLKTNKVPTYLFNELHGTPFENQFHLMLVKEVCERAGELHRPVSVNVPPHILTPEIAKNIVEIVEGSNRKDAIEIELTEDHPISDQRQFDAIRILIEAGIHVALDDYDTGNANEEALRQLESKHIHMDTIKIDRSHVQLGTASRLAEDLLERGYEVVVEGVESEQELKLLPEGCIIQGYIHGRARPAKHYTGNKRRSITSA